MSGDSLIFHAKQTDAAKRLDHFLHEQLPNYSRSRLQDWVKRGRVLVNGAAEKASHALRGADEIVVTPAELPPLHATPEEMALEILYEDSSVIAVNKPAGVVVHAGAGVHSGTLVNALLHHFESLSTVGGDWRPGIVHRLDRYTSGVILVARTDAAHRNLAEQFQARRVEKIYIALVHGKLKHESGRITAPITRDPSRRIRMTTRLGRGRNALTDYCVLNRFSGFTLLQVRIGTGRTHQIRVHLASLGHAVVGDRIYGAPAEIPGHPHMNRYFLHAHRLSFDSPATSERVTVESPLPADLATWLETLE